MRIRRIASFSIIAISAFLAACGDDDDGKSNNADRRRQSTEELAAIQPAETMNWSPTIETINFWIQTWETPGKLSFVYLQGANGEFLGYFVFEGLPVSYCASLTENWERAKIDGDGDDSRDEEVIVPAPGMDGVYYSGGQCNTYYGKDATTGAYVEYTAGLGINVLLFDEPLPRQDVQPLGQTDIAEAEQILSGG